MPPDRAQGLNSLARTTPSRTNFHGPKGVQTTEVRLFR